MNVALLGPAGSGKSTLSAWMVANADLAAFDTGATLRAWAAAHDPALAAHLGQGGMAPSELVLQLMGTALSQPPAGRAGWILDGTPRSVVQAEAVAQMNASGDLPLDAVFVLEAPREVLGERLYGRRTCAACGTLFHTSFAPAPRPGRCACGGPLTVRQDDTPEGAATRWDLYESTTLPGIAHLESAGVRVVRLAAQGRPEAVVAQAVAALPALRGEARAATIQGAGPGGTAPVGAASRARPSERQGGRRL